MHSRASFAIILIAMLLTQSLHGLKWQAMGSGMNNTVISEIWDGLEGNLNTVITQNDLPKLNTFLNDISDRLNARWSPAWNVVLIIGSSSYDTVLYGYAFRNQWMWYNGVPYANQNQLSIITLIIWKDYNCQDWKNIGDGVIETSSFSSVQKDAIRAEINKMTEAGIINDIWGTTYTMMKNLDQNALFSSGGYSVIMGQDGYISVFGRVCRVGDGFYHSFRELGSSSIFSNSDKGNFYLFQTR